jgi:hypothetical protein
MMAMNRAKAHHRVHEGPINRQVCHIVIEEQESHDVEIVNAGRHRIVEWPHVLAFSMAGLLAIAFTNRFEQELSFAPLWPLTKRA